MSAAPVYLVRGEDPSLVRDAVSALVEELVGDGDRSLMVDEIGPSGDDLDVGALADAAQTPPFLTERRVVVGRDLHLAKRDSRRRDEKLDWAPLIAYVTDPLPTTVLVLAWDTGTVAKKLADAVKAAGGTTVTTGPGRNAAEKRSWLTERVAAAGIQLDRPALDLVASTLGQDLDRLSGLLAALQGTFGPGAKLGAADVEPYLGEAGGVAPWDLTDAIDRGDIGGAVTTLHRLHGSGRMHAMQVTATLHGHLQRMLALDGSDVRSEKDAAALLGMKGSTFPAKKALDQGRKLGSEKVARAVALLAQADLDLRGHKAYGPDVNDELVLEVLVARLASLARR